MILRTAKPINGEAGQDRGSPNLRRTLVSSTLVGLLQTFYLPVVAFANGALMIAMGAIVMNCARQWAYSTKFDWRNVGGVLALDQFDNPRFSESFPASRSLISGCESSGVVGVYRDVGGSHRHQNRRTNMGLKITDREVKMEVEVLMLEGRIVLGEEESVALRE